MYDEWTIPILHVPLRLYFLLHFLGYASFLIVGVGLLRRRVAEWPHVVLLTMALLAADTLLAHVAFHITERGPGALFDPGAWRFFNPPYWGSPLIFAGMCGLSVLFRWCWPRLEAVRGRLPWRTRKSGTARTAPLPKRRMPNPIVERGAVRPDGRHGRVSSTSLVPSSPQPASHRELLDATCIAWAAANVFFKLACFVRGRS